VNVDFFLGAPSTQHQLWMCTGMLYLTFERRLRQLSNWERSQVTKVAVNNRREYSIFRLQVSPCNCLDSVHHGSRVILRF
jgi:hypothetical protein